MTLDQTDPHEDRLDRSDFLRSFRASPGSVTRDAWILLAIGAILMAGTFFASRGIIVIDELVYLIGAGTLQTTGSLLLDNGYDRFQFVELTFGPFFNPRADGLLASQYPIGQQLAGAVLHSLIGPRGLYVLNAVAALVALFATHALAMRLFRDRQIALWSCLLLTLGTYLVEYTYGYLPHMISVAAVLVSFNLALKAIDDERAGPVLKASFLSGLALGAGMLFRIDCILLLPVIAVLTVITSHRPVRVILGGALGLLPGMAVLAWSNHLKFGTINPLSYGPRMWGIDTYFLAIAIGTAGLCFLVAWRVLAPRYGKYLFMAGLGLAGLSLIAMPQVRALALAFLDGTEALIVDATATPDRRSAIDFRPDGTVLFWGLAKKALGQSMPWIGMLPLLALPALAGRRRAMAVLGVMSVVWITPFVLRSWHGGLGSNMRYFLPILPAICILGAAVLQAQAKAAGLGPRAIVYSVIAGCMLSALWISLHPTGHAGASQILSLHVLTASLAVAVAALAVRTPGTAGISVLVFGIGLGTAVTNLMTDVSHSQKRREDNALAPDFETTLTGSVIVFDRIVMSALGKPDQLLALGFSANGPDPRLVTQALDAGMAVTMSRQSADHLADSEGLEIIESDLGLGSDHVELRRRTDLR